MRLGVIGASGQLGSAFVRSSAADDWDVALAPRSDVDLADAGSIKRWVELVRPGVILNLAGYTDVAGAEIEPAAAFRVNADGVGNLAGVAQSQGIRLVHVSTDYVFGGSPAAPYSEDSAAAPLNAYGASKLAGEEHVLAVEGNAVLRVSWLFSEFGSNFVKKILDKAASDEALRVVVDEIGAPSPARYVCDALLTVCGRADCGGIFHFESVPAVSRHEFARMILDAAVRAGAQELDREVEAVSSAHLGSHVKRPADSTLSGDRLGEAGYRARDWRPELSRVVRVILGKA